MGTPVFVQKGYVAGSAVSSIELTLTGVGAGNLIVMNCLRQSTSNRDISTQDVTNTVNGTVAVAETVHTAGVLEVAIDFIPAAVGGNTLFRMTMSGVSSTSGFDVFEFSGAAASPFDASDTAEQATATTHVCADGGAVDTVADVAVVTCIVFNGTLGGGTNPSGYTMTTVTTINGRSGYKTSGTALTDEDASQTTVNARSSVGAVASFKGEATGGGTQQAAMSIGVWV